jgi:hypothetical protein
MNCRCDIYVLNFNYHCFAVLSCCMCSVLEAPHPGRQSKQELYIKNQYIPHLTEEHMSIYFSINRGIYGHVVRARRGGLSIFFGYV